MGSMENLLFFHQLLKELSGEEEPLSYEEINNVSLSRRGEGISQKSVTTCARKLRRLGIDVSGAGENKKGYYLRDRDFEEWELHVLIGLVGRCFFLSRKKSEELINKIAGLHSTLTAYALKKEVDLRRTPKTTNEEVPYTIDKLLRACRNGKKVRFTYGDYDITGSLVLKKKEGEIRQYQGSPYGFFCKKNCYYNVINMDPFPGLSNYRLDRMKGLEILEEEGKPVREISGYSNGLDMEEYALRSLKVFVGRPMNVTLEIDRSHFSFIFEDLWDQAKVVKNKEDENTYLVTFVGNEGEGLVRWILQMGEKARVIAPESLVKEMRKKVQAMAEHYN